MGVQPLVAQEPWHWAKDEAKVNNDLYKLFLKQEQQKELQQQLFDQQDLSRDDTFGQQLETQGRAQAARSADQKAGFDFQREMAEKFGDRGTMPRRRGGIGMSSDPVNPNLKPVERALLNAISSGESGGKYNIRYAPGGGKTFEPTGDHPRIFENSPNGPSSAAGRYQFVATTWDGLPKEAKGDGRFTPENQDTAALWLARSAYRKASGGDLDADIAVEGFSPRIQSILAPKWEAFKYEGKRSKYEAVFRNSLEKYSRTPPVDTPTPDDSVVPPTQGTIVQRQPLQIGVPSAQAAPVVAPAIDPMKQWNTTEEMQKRGLNPAAAANPIAPATPTTPKPGVAATNMKPERYIGADGKPKYRLVPNG